VRIGPCTRDEGPPVARGQVNLITTRPGIFAAVTCGWTRPGA